MSEQNNSEYIVNTVENSGEENLVIRDNYTRPADSEEHGIREIITVTKIE